MSLKSSPCDFLGPLLDEAGVVAWGVARAEDVSAEARGIYLDFIDRGHHGPMEWMERNLEARFTTGLILPDTRSIISVAFAYPEAPSPRSHRHPRWAAYALGDDYHEVIRRRLAPVASQIDSVFGAKSRVCVDTAPVMERYWAVKAGVGFRGRNGMVIVPGVGARVFLAEIFTTADLPATPPSPVAIACQDCGRCVSSCPAGALNGDGTVDARRCLSCLTIEYRGPLPESTPLGDRVYGCDTCRLVCPHEKAASSRVVDEFQPRESILAKTLDDLLAMSPGDFSSTFRHSAIKRTKHEGLLRNVKFLLNSGLK